MRVLLSTIGTRGDVQPLVALASALRELGAEVRLCVPPDFREWIEGLGFPVVPIGPELRPTAKPSAAPVTISPEQRRAMIAGTVAAQFETIGEAARGCDLIVGATALQLAAPSIAERLGIPYAFAAYCPIVLPSTKHAPPLLPMLGDRPAPALPDYSELWEKDALRWNAGWKEILDARRGARGLAPVDDVRSHVLTDHPWLAADPTLAPWPDAPGAVFQPGAWILPDARPLSGEIERFLDAGDPPVDFGFGSIRAPEGMGAAMIASARALGRRAIVLRGWTDLSAVDDGDDCLSIGEVNQQRLFERVACVVHHGGAGTTTAAARAGAPQLVIPQHYDQHFWGAQVERLGIGVSLASDARGTASLPDALGRTLDGAVAARARAVAREVRSDGAAIAARRLLAGDLRHR